MSVRLVRDPETLMGKGVGYVLLRSSECVLKALALHEQLFHKRALRVSVCGKRTKRTEARKAGASQGDKPKPTVFAGKNATVSYMQENAARRVQKKVR